MMISYISVARLELVAKRSGETDLRIADSEIHRS